ncbi:hypothetical protein NC653_034065 [Populus alba x Populus x berolinensis]|uniref:Uncharacterized protein n=1 Tax=Populus alba x Populus x berolinensis TaxID=444605 RepID=A0AAD6PVT4_9ROSI|nr:hypothetical protein NC653_034065 [Populus alba x Populus x berolinensis]
MSLFSSKHTSIPSFSLHSKQKKRESQTQLGNRFNNRRSSSSFRARSYSKTVVVGFLRLKKGL